MSELEQAAAEMAELLRDLEWYPFRDRGPSSEHNFRCPVCDASMQTGHYEPDTSRPQVDTTAGPMWNAVYKPGHQPGCILDALLTRIGRRPAVPGEATHVLLWRAAGPVRLTEKRPDTEPVKTP